MTLNKLILTSIILIIFVSIYNIIPLDGEVSKGLAILFLIASLWISELMPVTVTALLVPLIAVICGVFDVKAAFSNFAHPIIFLFLGGFALATALHKQKIDELIADFILVFSKNNFLTAVLFLFTITALLSMWISNTATTAMMLPIALGLIYRTDKTEDTRSIVFILLGTAYSANIGGIGTLVGSPPNAITAANLGMNFRDWLYIGLPSVAVLFPIMILTIYVIQKPDFKQKIKVSRNIVMDLKEFLTNESLTVFVIFMITVLLWLFSNPISKLLGIDDNFDSLVAMGSLISLVAFRTVTWKEVENFTDWGVLLLFGGGLTLSSVLSETGASKYMADAVNNLLAGYGIFVLILGAATLIVFLTEFASNTASSAILVPIFFAIGQDNPSITGNVLPLVIGIGASCAFMLPVATPPNALVYGTGMIKQSRMIYCGFILNLLSIVIISAMAYLFFN